jgi:hypothetical protein
MKKPKDYLENCEYISQDGDTVYIDEEALEACMEDYANQRIIEELEMQIEKYFKQSNTQLDLSKRLKDRIEELK